MIFGGIDPGLSGGLCRIDEAGKIIEYTKMPRLVFKNGKGKRLKKDDIDICGIRDFFEMVDFITLEFASAMPGNVKDGQTQGTAAMFNYGRGYGYIVGWILTSYLSHIVVVPRTWKKYFNISKDKAEAIRLAQEKAGEDFILPRCRKPHDGIAEAYLIADYGRLKYLKETGANDHE